MDTKYFKYILLLIILMILGISYLVFNNNEIDYDNLMIIVHPEDGLIWGGDSLLKNNYLVVCITCNSKNEDFIKIMKKMNNDYVLLGYKTNTDFVDEYNILNRDLKYYINKKDWKKIVTHNKEGEYGNTQNIIINNKVTKIVDNKDKLYFFNKYYVDRDFNIESKRFYKLSNEDILNKSKYLGMFNDIEYIEEFKHIIPYEEFVSYKEWGDLYE